MKIEIRENMALVLIFAIPAIVAGLVIIFG